MGRFGLWMTVLALLAAAMHSGLGQIPRIDPSAPPPAVGIQDDGFFDSAPEAKQRITARFKKLEADHGFRIFMLVEPVLIGTSAPKLAAELQQSWLPDGGGLVIVFESDSRTLGFGRDVDGEPIDGRMAGRLPTHETAAILSSVRDAMDPGLSPATYLETLASTLVKELESYFQRRNAPPPAGRSVRLALLTVGGLALLSLVAIGIGALVRLTSMAGKRRFRFPQVDRPERLGAPGGGGNVAVRRFRKK